MKNEQNGTASAEYDGVRAAVAHWNERLAKYRETLGADEKPPLKAYEHHPAHSELSQGYTNIFWGCREENASDWACDFLRKLSRDDDGNLLVDGKGYDYGLLLVKWSEESADRAAAQGRIAECGLGSTMATLWRALCLHLWECEPDDPLTIALREADV